MGSPFHLVVLPARGPTSAVVLGETPVAIGSAPTCQIRLEDAEISPLHATIAFRDGGYVLVREALPLLVNGLRAKAHLLSPFDLIVLGKNAISFRAGAPPAATDDSDLETIRRLHALGIRVRRREPPQELAHQLLDDVVELTGAARGSLVRFAGDDVWVGVASVNRGEFDGDEADFSRTLVQRMREEGHAVVVDREQRDAALADAKSLFGSNADIAAAIPVSSGDRLFGALYLSGSRASRLGPERMEHLELYAALAGDWFQREQHAITLERALDDLGAAADPASLLVGGSKPTEELRRALVKIAASPSAPVLINGETGTGKEVVAREIHRLSARASGPFIAVHCGAIPAELIGSELFGHKKGAFTQAVRDRPGHFRAAEGGTIFLDEIGDMPLAQQVALLRVLQERCVTPVGSEESIPVDVRVLCATHRSLDEEVRAGRFRQDLLFRIAVVNVVVPPLRDRNADILPLAEHFLRAIARQEKVPNVRFGSDAIFALSHARWPGNVRELEGAVRRAVMMRESDELSPADLALIAPARAQEVTGAVRPLAMVRDEVLRNYVREIVDRFEGNRTAAADALMVTPRTVFKYLEE